jgi:uncharacterized membrane protein
VSETQERETARVEAFSDGVFAIAITLLVLEFKVPHLAPDARDGDLFRSLLTLWPSLVAFLASFAAILITWINHHGLFRLIRKIDTPFLYANGFLLLMVTFVPFPTAVLAQNLGQGCERAAAVFYVGTFVVTGLAFNVFWWTAVRRGVLKSSVGAEHIQKIRKAYRFGLTIYIASTVVAFWSAPLGLGMCLSLWIYWTVLDYRAGGPGS